MTIRELFRPFYKSIAILFSLSLGSALLQLPLPLIYKYLIDHVFVSGNLQNLFVWILIIIAIAALSAGVTLYSRLFGIKIRYQFMSVYRKKLLQTIQNLSYRDYSSYMSGELTSRLIKDLDSLELLLPGGIAELTKNMSLTLGFILVLFLMNWKMTLGLSLTIPIFIWIFIFAQKNLRALAINSQKSQSTMHAKIQENIEGIRDIQLTNSQEFHHQKTVAVIETTEEMNRQLQEQQVKFESSSVWFQLSGVIVIWGIGGWMVTKQMMSLGELIGFSYAVNYVFGPLSALFHAQSALPFERSACERILQFLKKNNTEQDQTSPSTQKSIQGIVEFKDVSFSYPGGKKILENISFSIKPGEPLCIVGPSGSGKSTLISLLVKLWHPTSGQILIDGLDISEVPDTVLRQTIGFVPQTVFLFQGSLKENILMGRQVSPVIWEKACQLSGVTEMVKRLSHGFETIVGEKGANLSGGERQKVALARALLIDPQLVIMDEPSNNLDEESKMGLNEIILLAKEGKTIVVVTHDKELKTESAKVLDLSPENRQ